MRLVAVDASAAEAGLKMGLPLADARALVPALDAVAADPDADAHALAGLADWCQRYTPWTAVDGADGLWLDISGCAHLFGGEAALLTDLSERLAVLGLISRAAVADTPGAAWARARFSSTNAPHDGDKPWRVVAPGAMAKAMAGLPTAALRLDAVTLEGLSRMGVRRVSDLMALPRGPIAQRFGSGPLLRLDQALGVVEEPVSPRRPTLVLRTRMAFAEPIGTATDIACATARLLDALCRRLEEGHQGARRLILTCCRADGSIAEIRIGTSRASRDADHLARLFRDKLIDIDPGFGIDAMLLAAVEAEPLAPLQGGLGDVGSHDNGGENIARLLDRLVGRLGAGRVFALAPHESHMPEKAQRPASPLATAVKTAAPTLGFVANHESYAPTTPRPIHLLPMPERIEVMAPVPDHPPVIFRWRRHQHRVRHAEGPERIGPEWWLQQPEDLGREGTMTRDYYRIEDEAGQRFWVYREGLYRADMQPCWYLHGFFS